MLPKKTMVSVVVRFTVTSIYLLTEEWTLILTVRSAQCTASVFCYCSLFTVTELLISANCWMRSNFMYASSKSTDVTWMAEFLF